MKRLSLKIATNNINGINGRLEQLMAWLKLAPPDVVSLQELKLPSSRFPINTLNKAGYGAVWVGESAYNAVAIWAKDAEPLVVRRALPGYDSDKQARYIAEVRGWNGASDYAQTWITLKE